MIKEMLQSALKELSEELAQGHTPRFLALLERAPRFYQYSWGNQLLIWSQRPNATVVAGFNRWKELGRYVRRGEKGIAIMAPILRKVEEDEEKRSLAGFRTTHVFDISQTEGQPLPSVDLEVSGPDHLYQRLKEACPYPVLEEDLAQAQGMTDGKQIWVRTNLSPTQKAATLLHEWAHALMHFGQEGPRDDTMRELEAEAVAYAVGRQLGLGMEGSRDYVLHWKAQVDDLARVVERVLRGGSRIMEQLGGSLSCPLGGHHENRPGARTAAND